MTESKGLVRVIKEGCDEVLSDAELEAEMDPFMTESRLKEKKKKKNKKKKKQKDSKLESLPHGKLADLARWSSKHSAEHIAKKLKERPVGGTTDFPMFYIFFSID
jgi:hypothetical protein